METFYKLYEKTILHFIIAKLKYQKIVEFLRSALRKKIR